MANDTIDYPAALIVNTDKYTGNFERQICAYATGCYGDCEVGDDEALLFEQWCADNHHDENIFEGYVAYRHDDHGCSRPVSIYHDRSVDKESYTSLIIYLEEPLDDILFNIVIDRMRHYGKAYDITIKGARMIKRELKITDTVVKSV